MNYLSTLKTIENKEKHFDSYEYLSNLKNNLYIFISSWLPEGTKPKIEEEIRNLILKKGKTQPKDLYDIQLQAISIIKNIEMSHILGVNDKVLEHLAFEYAELFKILKDLEKRLVVFKSYNQTKDLIENMIKSFKTETIYGHLVKDLHNLNCLYTLNEEAKTNAINIFKLNWKN